MKPNYNGNKKRREEAKRKKQEQKRAERLQRKHASDEAQAGQPQVLDQFGNPVPGSGEAQQGT